MTTFYDSKAEVLRKYPPATETVAYLESHSQVAYKVDATKLQDYELGMFDLIFFTFPQSTHRRAERRPNPKQHPVEPISPARIIGLSNEHAQPSRTY